MPDFTNLDPAIVASFWIYFVASFVIGIIVGGIAVKVFFHREKRIFKKEKEGYLEQLDQLEETKRELAEKKAELDKLKKEMVNNPLYWRSKKQEGEAILGDKALHDIIHKQGE